MATKVRAWAHQVARVDFQPFDSSGSLSNSLPSQLTSTTTTKKKEVQEELCWNGVQFHTRKEFLAKLAGLVRHSQIPTDWRFRQRNNMVLGPEAMALKVIEERYNHLKLRYLKGMWEKEHTKKRVAESVANMTNSKLEHHIGMMAQKFGKPLDEKLWHQVQSNQKDSKAKEQRRLKRNGGKRHGTNSSSSSGSRHRAYACSKSLRGAWVQCKALAFAMFDWQDHTKSARKALSDAEEFMMIEAEREKSLARDRKHKRSMARDIPRKCMVIESEHYSYPGAK